MNTNWEALAKTPAAAVVAPVRQGWLQQYRRAGGMVRGWKGVFCVLVGETLCEYADHDAAAPARLVALRGARVVLPNAATDSATAREGKDAQRYPHSLFVDTPAGQLLWLAAETDQDARAWATALRDAACRHAYAAAAATPAACGVPALRVAVPCAFCCERCEHAAVAALDRVLGYGGDAGDVAGCAAEDAGSSGWQYELDRSNECVLLRGVSAARRPDVPQQVVQALRDAGFFANIIVAE